MTITNMQQPMQIQPGLQDPRQRYGLGSFVKKAIRGVKKIAKSPIGKAALMYAGTAGLGNLMGGGGNWANVLGKGGWMRPGAMMGNFSKAMPSMFANPTGKAALHQNPGFFPKMWGGMTGGQKAFTGLSAFALGAPLVQSMFAKGKDVVEDVDEDYIDPYTAMMMAKFKNPQMNFLPADRFTDNYYQTAVPAANGGRIGYGDGMIVEDEEEVTLGLPTLMRQRSSRPGYQGGELVEQESVEEIQLPDEAEQMLQMEYQKYVEGGGQLPYPEFKKLVLQKMREESQPPEELVAERETIQEVPAQGIAQLAAGGMAEQGMIDMGGMEKDYRAEGGFVPLGGQEKADDVPARLSKNEFVFTADAVRAAGGGDIDAGAEVMENVMNNLEQGGQISQGSQGDGGEEIISEEEIIEGPGGAQEMYEQQQMLQSRMA